MSTETIDSIVINTLSEVTLTSSSDIAREMHLEADLGVDSISMASLLAKFETIINEHPKMHEYMQTLMAAETVGELIDLLKGKPN